MPENPSRQLNELHLISTFCAGSCFAACFGPPEIPVSHPAVQRCLLTKEMTDSLTVRKRGLRIGAENLKKLIAAMAVETSGQPNGSPFWETPSTSVILGTLHALPFLFAELQTKTMGRVPSLYQQGQHNQICTSLQPDSSILRIPHPCRLTLLRTPGHSPKTIHTRRKACYSMCNVNPEFLKKKIIDIAMEAIGQHEQKSSSR